MSSAEREFDIVVYGVTGYSGKLTAQYLARVASEARIALAGRSRERLLAVRETLGPTAQDWPLIVADTSQPAAVQAMAACTRVVVTTVGPYTTHGLPVVAACAKAGTDYADLTGEVMFVRTSIDRYHQQAVDTGARIVISCGFASIPSDLNVYQLYRRAQGDGAGELCDTTLVFRSFFQGGGSGGTVASEFESMRTASSDPEARRQMDDPYTLTTDRGAEPDLGRQPDFLWRRGGRIAPELAGFWSGGLAWAPDQKPSGAAQQRITELALRQAVSLLGDDEFGKVLRGTGGRRRRDRDAGGRVRLGWQALSAIAAALVVNRRETGHRSGRGDAGTRPLHGADVCHHDVRCPVPGDVRTAA